uniref:Uncharacterized protein n=1 Tax=Anguilla anguilla TaxID=7936 RepID=A0A0E9VBD7_ANGAN
MYKNGCDSYTDHPIWMHILFKLKLNLILIILYFKSNLPKYRVTTTQIVLLSKYLWTVCV